MTDVNRIEVSADFQDITITVGEYGDVDARQAISVVDAGGDGSLAYNNSTGVITYTGPSAADVRAHFSAGTGISLVNGVITNTQVETNTTYTQNASATSGGANLNLVGSDATTDSVKFAGSGATAVTRTDADTITISSTDTNTTYTQDVTAATGGANLNLRGSDSSADTVKFAAGAGITVAETDASTITITSTITQYTDALARQAISVVDAGGFGSLAYNNGTGVITYTGPSSADIRTTVSAANTGTGYGELNYNQTTGTFTYTRVTDANIRGAISVNDTGGDGSLSYNNGTGVITYTGPSAAEVRAHFTGGTGVSITNGDIALDFTEFSTTNIVEGTNLYYTDARARAAISVNDTGGYGELSYNNGTGVITYTGPSGTDIRTEVQDGRNLTYTSAVLNLDKTLVDVNSVASESGQLLTLQGSQIRLEGRIDGSSTGMFNAVTEGYLFGSTGSTPGSIAGPSATGGIAGFISSTGTTTDEMYRYQWKGDISTGSNQILNCRVYSATEFTVATPLTWDSTIVNRVVGKPVHYGGGTSFPTTPARFPLGARVQSVSIDPGNPTLATVTLEASDLAANANSTATTTGAVGSFSHYARNSTSTYVVLINSTTATGADAPGTMRVSEALATPTGYLTSISVAYFSHSYTVAPTLQVTGRKRIRLQTDNPINEHINVPFGLGVGPGAVSTNRGIPLDPSDAIGINLYNPGTVNGYTGRTIFNLTQSTDNSFYTAASATPGSGVPVEKSGGQFSFNHIRGNANSAISAIYGRNGDGLGGITWWSNAGSSATSLVSSTHTTAGIYAAATEDHTGNATGGNSGAQANASGKHGSGVAMQYTPNASGISRPRTFLLANDKTVELRSVDSVVLKPVSKTVSNITDRALFSTVNHTWLTAGDYVLGNAASNTTSMTYGTGAKVTVGITNASGNNGDVGLVLQRATGNTANFELKLPTGSSNTLELINNATSTTIATVTDSAIAVNANTRVTGGLRTYGEFAYTGGNITIAAQNTIYAFPLDTTLVNSGTSISNTSRINISRTGFFKIIMSLQATSITNGVNSFTFWLRKNGADVANSKTEVDFLKDQKSVIAMDWLVESDGDDYWEIVYATASANFADITFPTIAATTTPYVSPLAPALIVNVIPIGL